MIALMQQGGWVMWAILAVSLLAWALVTWQWLALRGQPLQPPPWTEQVLADCRAGQLEAALASCQRTSGPVANLLGTGLACIAAGRRWQYPVAAAFRWEGARLHRLLPLIAVTAAALPLLGLLGTVHGLILTFDSLATAGPVAVAQLADGVSTALVTTQTGLAAALPILLMHRFLSSRVRRTVDVLAICRHRLESVMAA
jgi:biopolymer transport protein ExbB